MLGTGYWTLDTGCWILELAESKTKNPETNFVLPPAVLVAEGGSSERKHKADADTDC